MCVGKATRLARFLAEGEKVYRATVRLGFATTTDDATGEPLAPSRTASVGEEAIRDACRRHTGPQWQVPPVYSAKRHEGERLYALARRGAAIKPTPVLVTVHAIELVALEGGRLELVVGCSPGTYIRSLARDLGETLGVGAHLSALCRTRSGAFGLEDALAWEALPTGARDALTPLEALLPEMPAVRVGEEGLQAVRHGRDLRRDLVVSGFPESAPPFMRVLDEGNRLLAVAVPRGFQSGKTTLSPTPVLHPDVVLVE